MEVHNPLPTHSGQPHLSPEQREYFEQQKMKCMESIGYVDHGTLKQIFGLYGSDFDRWRVLDLKEPKAHPVHLNRIMAVDHQDKMIDWTNHVYALHQMKKIDDETYNIEIMKIRYQMLLALAEWDLKAKKELKELKSKLDCIENEKGSEQRLSLSDDNQIIRESSGSSSLQPETSNEWLREIIQGESSGIRSD